MKRPTKRGAMVRRRCRPIAQVLSVKEWRKAADRVDARKSRASSISPSGQPLST